MTLFELFQSQLVDPFRIGLLIALVVTMLRTQEATGTLVPLLAGVLFVALILPATLSPPGTKFATAVVIGIFANAVILALILGALSLWRRARS